MNNQDQNSRKRKNPKTSGILVSVGILFLIQVLNGAGIRSIGLIVVILLTVGIAVVIGVIAGKLYKAQAGASKGTGASSTSAMGVIGDFTSKFTPRREQEDTFAPRESNQMRYYDDGLSAANSERDKQRRIEQLDSFLKNGIIDKAEYNRLRSSYRE